MPEGQTSADAAAALNLDGFANSLGRRVASVLGDGWERKNVSRGGAQCQRWFRKGAQNSERRRIRQWFEGREDGQSTAECLAALQLEGSAVAAGVKIGHALGDEWQCRSIRRNGEKARCWYRLPSPKDHGIIDATVNEPTP